VYVSGAATQVLTIGAWFGCAFGPSLDRMMHAEA